MEHPPNPEFLHKKYKDLSSSPEVDRIVKRKAQKTGEREIPPTKPHERIQNYLDYLQECISIEDPKEREGKLKKIKQVLYDKYITKPEQIPESYWTSIIRRHREEGHGDIEIPEDQKGELTRDIITEQTRSLDSWIDYLASPDAEYPDWFKYYAIRSILKLNRYDKEKKQFTDRTKGTVSPFPDLSRDALGLICDALEKKQKREEVKFGYDIAAEDKTAFHDHVQKENFAKMYAWAIEHFNPIPEELLKKTKGEWRKFAKDSNASDLVTAIAPYSTGWCIRGEATATRYLTHSDLEVYFSEDENGAYSIPRVVVVRRDGQTTEVRGIAPDENLDPYINDVVNQKLQELPDGKSYQKKVEDMKHLTFIEKKYDKKGHKWKEELTRDELLFLYEINATIDGFGYPSESGDPRIKELRAARNPKEDAPIVFECEPNQIAWKQEEITENTKAYVGPLFKGFFELTNLEHIYTSFPEGKIREYHIEIGGKTKDQLKTELETQGFKIYPVAKEMMDSSDFTTNTETKKRDLIRLKVGDLGFTHNPTTDEIYQKAQELGLDLCPAEVGPHFRLQFKDQPMNDYVYVGMKQIAAAGSPHIFARSGCPWDVAGLPLGASRSPMAS